MACFLYFDTDTQVAYIMEQKKHYNVGERVLTMDQEAEKIVPYKQGNNVIGKVIKEQIIPNKK